MFAIQPSRRGPARRSEQPAWQALARCSNGTGSMIELFFSEQLDDIAAAKAFCLECPVQEPCLEGAVARREPWGVWGGELFVNGKIVAQKRKRGRPPKVRPEACPTSTKRRRPRPPDRAIDRALSRLSRNHAAGRDNETGLHPPVAGSATPGPPAAKSGTPHFVDDG